MCRSLMSFLALFVLATPSIASLVYDFSFSDDFNSFEGEVLGLHVDETDQQATSVNILNSTIDTFKNRFFDSADPNVTINTNSWDVDADGRIIAVDFDAEIFASAGASFPEVTLRFLDPTLSPVDGSFAGMIFFGGGAPIQTPLNISGDAGDVTQAFSPQAQVPTVTPLSLISLGLLGMALIKRRVG